MAKLHYIADKSLVGLEREYTEVERKADVGDYVVITEIILGEDYRGEIFKVTELDGKHVNTDGVFEDGSQLNPHIRQHTTLSPTDIIRTASGERFRLAERLADVGEKVVVVEKDKMSTTYDNGDIFSVDLRNTAGIIFTDNDDSVNGLYHSEYRVLEPVEDVDNELHTHEITAVLPELPQTVEQDNRDLIIELSRTVARLERKLAEVTEQADSNAKDIRTWADSFTEFKHSPSPWAEQSDILRLNAQLEKLREQRADELRRIDEHRRRGGCI